jgi:hypothetical protein
VTISVASYLMGIPLKNTKAEKPAIITGFIEGVLREGDNATVSTGWQPLDVDVAVVQGFVHMHSKNSPHLDLRKRVFEYQQARGKRSIIVDSNLFLYADKGNTKGYLRYSYDGIFPNTGEYCNENPDPARWDKISKDLGISLKPWRAGRHILICCQRDGGWSMDGQELMPWLLKVIKKIRTRSDREIMVRFHPGDKARVQQGRQLTARNIPGVTVSQTESILDDLRTAHVMVHYNSSPGVVAAIEGVPVVSLDPLKSQAAEVSTHHLNMLDNPPKLNRDLWILKMAQMHWTLDEIKDGTAWRHLRKYV